MMSQVGSHAEGRNPDTKRTNSPTIKFAALVEQQQTNQKNKPQSQFKKSEEGVYTMTRMTEPHVRELDHIRHLFQVEIQKMIRQLTVSSDQVARYMSTECSLTIKIKERNRHKEKDQKVRTTNLKKYQIHVIVEEGSGVAQLCQENRDELTQYLKSLYPHYDMDIDIIEDKRTIK